MIENNGKIKTIKASPPETIKIGVSCIICGDSVELNDYEAMCHSNIVKVCEKCKKAVMKMRETIEHEGKGE